MFFAGKACQNQRSFRGEGGMSEIVRLSKPFVSQAQRGWMYATRPEPAC